MNIYDESNTGCICLCFVNLANSVLCELFAVRNGVKIGAHPNTLLYLKMLLNIIYWGDIMKTEEKYERMDIIQGENRIGCVSVRYPVFSEKCKKINRFYEELASSYIRFAEKRIPRIKKYKTFAGSVNCVLFCKNTFVNERYLSVKCEARIYTGNERNYTKCFSNVWCLPECVLAYKRKYGIRCSNVGFNGKELYLFDK